MSEEYDILFYRLNSTLCKWQISLNKQNPLNVCHYLNENPLNINKYITSNSIVHIKQIYRLVIIHNILECENQS